MVAHRTILITGGAGFIGSTLVKQFLCDTDAHVVNVDKLTYAGNLQSLASVSKSAKYRFEQADICDLPAMKRVMGQCRPDAVVHLAAESHVDRSIDGPAEFIQTNIVGTSVILEVIRDYLGDLPHSRRNSFRFLHVSTDEVYGSLPPDRYFTEGSPYHPNSPYAASKAAADHLVRAWHETYGTPVLITNCGNNYGPFQYPEKLVPLMILTALKEKPLPVYGDGQNVRDWIYVEDHCRALRTVLASGRVGETYLIGAAAQLTNMELVVQLCSLLDGLSPRRGGGSYRELINFVDDRPGHDRRYALDASKIRNDLGWSPREEASVALRETVKWYLDNLDWCNDVTEGSYRGERLGMSK